MPTVRSHCRRGIDENQSSWLTLGGQQREPELVRRDFLAQKNYGPYSGTLLLSRN
jgi:hypothetical protein